MIISQNPLRSKLVIEETIIQPVIRFNCFGIPIYKALEILKQSRQQHCEISLPHYIDLKILNFWNSGHQLLYDENALYHTANTKMTIINYSLYSSKLAHSKFVHFSRLKLYLKGKCFENISEIQSNFVLLFGIEENEFKRCFQHCEERSKKYISNIGENLERELNNYLNKFGLSY